MPLGDYMYKLPDPQHQCAFFATPAEIRRAIYAHLIPDRLHISLWKNAIRLSPCVQRDRDSAPHCGNQQSEEARANDCIYAQRLKSSWGAHWRCDETAIQLNEDCRTSSANTTMTLLAVCKRMFTDVAETIGDTVIIEITDFDTLGILFANTGRNPSPLSYSLSRSRLLGIILSNIKELRISLKLPLAVYENLEHTGSHPSPASLMSTWMVFPLAIKHLEKLRRLQIWLDHEEPCSWSVVNERVILSPLASLSSIPGLNISISIPKLHPKWETSDRHFIDDSAPLPITIHRRYRQRYHGIKGRNGNLLVKYEPDFPILHEFAELDDMTMEELEEMESDCWKRGVDPLQGAMALDPLLQQV